MIDKIIYIKTSKQTPKEIKQRLEEYGMEAVVGTFNSFSMEAELGFTLPCRLTLEDIGNIIEWVAAFDEEKYREHNTHLSYSLINSALRVFSAQLMETYQLMIDEPSIEVYFGKEI